jgi:hypothetical protein
VRGKGELSTFVFLKYFLDHGNSQERKKDLAFFLFFFLYKFALAMTIPMKMIEQQQCKQVSFFLSHMT